MSWSCEVSDEMVCSSQDFLQHFAKGVVVGVENWIQIPQHRIIGSLNISGSVNGVYVLNVPAACAKFLVVVNNIIVCVGHDHVVIICNPLECFVSLCVSQLFLLDDFTLQDNNSTLEWPLQLYAKSC